MFVGAVFFPLLGASITGFFGRWIGDRAAQWSSVLCMVLAAICGILAFGQVALGGQAGVVPIVTWMDVGGFEVSWALRYDIRGDDTDEAGYHFQDEQFEIGEYVSIREAKAMHTYRVVSVEPL